MTTKTIGLPNRSVEFTFHENAHGDWWDAQISFYDLSINFCISSFLAQDDIDWEDVADLIKSLDRPGWLQNLIDDAQILATAVGKAFFRLSLGEVEEYEMQFEKSIRYKGKANYRASKDSSWQINFTYGTLDRTDGDAYGDYQVDFYGSKIIGARRVQV